MILIIITLIFFLLCFIISSIYLYSKYNDAKRRLDYWYENDCSISKIVSDRNKTNKEKIKAIKWEFDNLPF